MTSMTSSKPRVEKETSPEKLDTENDDVMKNREHLSEKNIMHDDVVLITVSGCTFELEIDDIRRAPSSKLYKYALDGKRNALHFKV
mgnify:CR=1 FL=1